MDNIVECVMAGGPEHGLVLYLMREPAATEPPSLMAADGRICHAAACMPSATCTARYVLLHPDAHGGQFLDVLRPQVAAPRQPTRPCTATPIAA